MSEHTPTPWVAEENWVLLGDGTTIAALIGDDTTAEANARYIVLAVNAHADLVEALREARRYVVGAYECAFPDEHENAAVLAQVDAALAKAEALREGEK